MGDDEQQLVTVEEVYARAVFAGRLHSGDAASPTDVLAAMAVAGSELGSLLYRLRSEYDQAKGQQAHALQHQRELADAIKGATVALKRAQRPGSPRYAERDDIARDLQALQKQAERDALLDHLALLEHVPTLPHARQALGKWAETEATRYLVREVRPHPLLLKSLHRKALTDRRPGPSPYFFELWRMERKREQALQRAARYTSLTPAAVRALVSGVLQVLLDPHCRSCGGRGIRGSGLAEKACRACGGTGRAQDSLQALGQDDEQRAFAGYLLASVERMVSAVDRRMRAYLRDRQKRG